MTSVYFKSGYDKEHLPSSISPDEEGSAQFAKIAGTTCGSVGVFTYNMMRKEENTKKMAIMWSVPFDYNFYSNWYAVGIYNTAKPCDSKLYREMYYEDDKQFYRYQADSKSETYRQGDVVIKCKMTNCCEPTVIIDITSSEPVQARQNQVQNAVQDNRLLLNYDVSDAGEVSGDHVNSALISNDDS